MHNTPTTPASVASRLTDEEILKLSKMAEYNFSNDAVAVQTTEIVRDADRQTENQGDNQWLTISTPKGKTQTRNETKATWKQ